MIDRLVASVSSKILTLFVQVAVHSLRIKNDSIDFKCHKISQYKLHSRS